MFINIMVFLIIATGLVSTIVSIQEYLKIKKDTQHSPKTQVEKSKKTEAIIYIILNVAYFIVGILLILKLISIQSALIYMIISKSIEKIVEYKIKRKIREL